MTSCLGEARSRSDADRALSSLLEDNSLDSWFRTKTVAALGDTSGPMGSPALRSELAAAMSRFETAKPHNRPDYSDLICACVWALAQRDGPQSTDILVQAAAHANYAVREYGLTMLAAVGDDRAWNDMLAALAARLAKKITSGRRCSDAHMIIGYLARHCRDRDDRSERLAALLRERWTRLDWTDVLGGRYPGVGPGGPPPGEIDFATYHPPAPWQRRAATQTQWERHSNSDAFEFTAGN